MNFIKEKFSPVFSLVANRNYREFIRLLFYYGNSTRYRTCEIKFLNYTITVPDTLSFIFQFKDIFVNESYFFVTDTTTPVIIDCGANIGISCLYFKKLYPKAKIKALEADSNIASILKKNFLKNSINDIEVIPKAVWVHNNGLSFHADGADGGKIAENGKYHVESIRLKEIIEQESNIDFLKMDIEGAEVDVITDCRESLLKIHSMFIEYHSWHDEQQRLDELLHVLAQYGFRYHIKSISDLKKPFSEKKIMQNLQLNIFVTR